MSAKSKEIPVTGYACNGKLLTLDRPRVMAIVNLTPDSFYDGGKFSGKDDVLRDVEHKIAAGATIIDVGAASSRPGSAALSQEEEWKRLASILPMIRKRFPDVFISIDTFHASVAEKAVNEGTDIINDISGGKMDAGMFAAVARLNVPYILMHLDGTPATMQHNAPYADVVNEVKDSLSAGVQRLQLPGFEKIILDPGFGFGKSLQNNYQLLKGLPAICSLGYPVLAGISRKSMIGKVTGSNPVTSLNGTTVLNTLALLNGASILRVHDAEEARQAIELVEFYKNA